MQIIFYGFEECGKLYWIIEVSNNSINSLEIFLVLEGK